VWKGFELKRDKSEDEEEEDKTEEK